MLAFILWPRPRVTISYHSLLPVDHSAKSNLQTPRYFGRIKIATNSLPLFPLNELCSSPLNLGCPFDQQNVADVIACKIQGWALGDANFRLCLCILECSSLEGTCRVRRPNTLRPPCGKVLWQEKPCRETFLDFLTQPGLQVKKPREWSQLIPHEVKRTTQLSPN